MLENANEITGKDRQQAEVLNSIIREILDGVKNPKTFTEESALTPKQKNLIALSSALATQRERDVIVSCVTDCLKTGAEHDEVAEVLRLAVLMAEIPADRYIKIVHDAVESFEKQNKN